MTQGSGTITLLGSGGWAPSEQRETCCVLARRGGSALLLDAGTGIRHLLTDGELLAGVERLDIVLTHFHLDHVVGLAYLVGLPPLVERHLWGPGALLYGAPTQAICSQLLGPPFFSAPLDAGVHAFHDITSSDLHLASWTVAHRVQPRHSVPVLGLRLGDDLAYCTDTAPDPDTTGFAQGVATLAHDAWSTSSAPSDVDTHSTAREAAHAGSLAGAAQVVLIHLHPRADDAALLDDAAGVWPAAVGADRSVLAAS